MDRNKLETKLRGILVSRDIKDQLNILSDFDVCINKLRKELQSKIDTDYCYCNNCNNYFLKAELQTESELKTEYGQCVYTDAGYGDDDEFADVTYRYIWYICPNCHSKILKKRYYISESNRRGR